MPTATPTEFPPTLQIYPTPGAVVLGTLANQCKNQYLALVTSGSGGVRQAEVAPESPPWSPPATNSACYPSQNTSWVPTSANCRNPERILRVRDINGGEAGWSVEYRCPDNQQAGALLVGGIGTTGINPVVGFAIVASAAVMLTSNPATVTVVMERAGSGIANAGRFFANSIQEAQDFILGIGAKPATMNMRNPNHYVVLLEDGVSTGSLRVYPEGPINWRELVYIQPLGTPVDLQTVAVLQTIQDGSRGPTLVTRVYSRRQNGAAMPLEDALALELKEGYHPEGLYPGAQPWEPEKHSGDSLAKGKKWAGYNKYLNQNIAWTSINTRPPHDWCGYRAYDNTCACANYDYTLARWVIETLANEVVNARLKVSRGIALMWALNPTALTDVKPRVNGANQWSEGMKPKGARFDDFQTINPDNPDDPNRDKCPPHFGLMLAGREKEEGEMLMSIPLVPPAPTTE